MFAEIEAVGVPAPVLLMNANFEELVAIPPKRTSWVVILSNIAPDPSVNGEPPFVTGRIPVISVIPPFKLTAEDVNLPNESE